MPGDEFDSLFGDELEQLMEVERGVLEMRFGLLDGLPLTLAQIATRFGRSRARVHQIEQRALRKLRYRKRGEPLYRYVHGRQAETKRWNERGVEYLLDELARGGRRNRPHFEEPPPPAGQRTREERTPSRRRSKLPIASRRIVEWIAQGFSYSAILAADRRLQPEDIYKAASDLLAIADATPASAAAKRSTEHAAQRRGVRRRQAAMHGEPEAADTATAALTQSQEAQASDRTPVERRDAQRPPAVREPRVWRTEERPRAATVKPWLREDDEGLRRLYAEGRHLAEIASLLGRRFGQVQSRIVRLNLMR